MSDIQGGSIVWDFDANLSDFNKKLDQASSKADSFGNTANKSADTANSGFLRLGVIAGAAAGVVSTGLNKAINLVSNSITDAVSRVDTLNNSTRVFEDMGFSVSDVQTNVKQLTTSILGLPTSLDQAISGVQILTASTNDIGLSTKLFESLNNAILGFGGNAEEVQNAVVQLSQDLAQGRITGQTWMSLLNSGLGPALAAMARQMGITTNQLRDGLSDGSVSVQSFETSLINMNTNGGGGLKSFQKIAEDSTKGIGSSFANAQTAITRGVADIINAVGSANIASAIQRTGKVFEDVMKGIAGGITTVIGYIKDFNSWLSQNRNTINNIIQISKPFVAILGSYLVVIKIYDAFKTLQVGLEVFRLVTIPSLIASMQTLYATMLANPILLIAAVIIGALIYLNERFGIFGKALDAIKVAWGAVTNFISDHAEILKKILLVVAGLFLLPVLPIIALVALVVKNFGAIENVVSSVFNAIKTVITTVFGAIAAVYNAVLKPVFDFMISVITTIATIYIRIWALILLVIVGTLTIIATFIFSILTKIYNFIAPIFQAIFNVIKGVFDFIRDIIVNAWNFYYGIISGALSAIWNVITTIFNAVKGFVSGVFDFIKGIIVNAWNFYYNIISGALSSIWNAVTSVFNSVISFVGGIGGKIVSAIGNLGSTLYNAGKDLIQGLINGAGSLLSKLAEFFLDKVPGPLKGAFKKALGISSPSKVFAGYGQNIVQGLVNGIKSTTKTAVSAVSTLGNSLGGVGTNIDFGATSSKLTSVGSGAGEIPAGGNTTSVTNHIGTIKIDSEVDAQSLISKLTRNEDLAYKGVTPAGAQ